MMVMVVDLIHLVLSEKEEHNGREDRRWWWQKIGGDKRWRKVVGRDRDNRNEEMINGKKVTGDDGWFR